MSLDDSRVSGSSGVVCVGRPQLVAGAAVVVLLRRAPSAHPHSASAAAAAAVQR